MTLTQREIDQLHDYLGSQLGEDADKFDLDSEIDTEISYMENKSIIAEKIAPLIEERTNRATILGDRQRIYEEQQEYLNSNKIEIPELKLEKNYKPIAILGNPDTGKTNLLIYLAKRSGFEKKYILGYPGKISGFTNLHDMRDIAKIHDCVLVIDEIDMIIQMYDKKSNDQLRLLLKFASHNRIKVIFDTQLSQFVTKMMDALVPQWAITELDIFELKNGSKPKRILLDYIKNDAVINSQIGMTLPLGQFVWYNDKAQAGESGIYEFPDQHIGKDWGNKSTRDKQKEINTILKSR